METNTNSNMRTGQWLAESVSVKLVVIGLLAIFLLIPASQISSLIRERQQRQQEVVAEVGWSWSGPQVLSGPVLVVPYKTMVKTKVGEVEQQEERIHHLYLLPDEVSVVAQTDAKLLHRGIFDAAVYEGKVDVNGHFGTLDLAKAEMVPGDVLWEKARLVVGVGDLKGLKNNPVVTLDGQRYDPDTEYANIGLFDNNLVVAPRLSGEPWQQLPFSFSLDLRGSGSLRFLQLAKHTRVAVNGNWTDPKFFGYFLPEERDVSEQGFAARWEVPHFSRQLPQQWKAARAVITESETPVIDSDGYAELESAVQRPTPSAHGEVVEAAGFGIRFLQPVDHYQKAERTAKYAILIIVLTFVSLFFTEIIAKRRIHIIQYVLIGAAMIVYYTLLLSLSEHVGFNAAYGIASLATIGLVGTFIAQLMRKRRIALIFSAILSVFYVFIFVIIQLQDMALLFGSIGLFVTVALLMYFSGRINWSQREEAPNK